MAYEELCGSPKMTLTAENGHSMTRVFRVPWSESAAFAELMFLTGFPGFPTSMPQSILLEPFLGENDPASGTITNPAASTAQYQYAKATVSYATTLWGAAWPSAITRPEHDVATKLTVKTRFSGQFLTVPARATEYEDASPGDEDKPVPPEDAMNRILIPLVDYQVDWDWVANPPRDKLREFLGKCNSEPFMGCEPETLMCEAADVSPSFRPAVDPRCYRVSVVLKQRRIEDGGEVRGWNHEYREDPAGWVRIKLPDGALRYPAKDFADMFEQ
jgi:hypothetical protein